MKFIETCSISARILNRLSLENNVLITTHPAMVCTNKTIINNRFSIKSLWIDLSCTVNYNKYLIKIVYEGNV